MTATYTEQHYPMISPTEWIEKHWGAVTGAAVWLGASGYAAWGWATGKRKADKLVEDRNKALDDQRIALENRMDAIRADLIDEMQRAIDLRNGRIAEYQSELMNVNAALTAMKDLHKDTLDSLRKANDRIQELSSENALLTGRIRTLEAAAGRVIGK